MLGPLWEDDGDPGTSLDLTDPPAACAPFTPLITARTETVLHEFSFAPSADGTLEQGHVNFAALRLSSPATVTTELAAVAQPSFAACADASAVRHFQETQTGIIDLVSAKPLDLPVPGRHVLWRATVAYHSESGTAHTMYMDVTYVAALDVLVKVRIASCGCRPPRTGDSPLLPGENEMLQSIEQRLVPVVSS